MFYQVASLVCVGILWGATNPLIKAGSKDITNVKANNAVTKFMFEIKYLLTNVQYLIPMALNQLGSVVYFFALQNIDLSLAVPVANSLTFVFTAIVGKLLGEQAASKNTYIGMVLILIGTSLCCYDKYLVETNRMHESEAVR